MKKTRYVVADDIPVAFLGIELDRKSTDVACKVRRAFVSRHRGEADEGGRLLAGASEHVGSGDFGERLVCLEKAMRAKAARMHDPLGYALVVEVEELLSEMEIF